MSALIGIVLFEQSYVAHKKKSEYENICACG